MLTVILVQALAIAGVLVVWAVISIGRAMVDKPKPKQIRGGFMTYKGTIYTTKGTQNDPQDR